MPKNNARGPAPAWDKLAALQSALYGPEITPEERRDHGRQVAKQAARDLNSQSVEAEFRDCLEFAKAYGLTGSPKYRHNAIRSLHRAVEIIAREAL